MYIVKNYDYLNRLATYILTDIIWWINWFELKWFIELISHKPSIILALWLLFWSISLARLRRVIGLLVDSCWRRNYNTTHVHLDYPQQIISHVEEWVVDVPQCVGWEYGEDAVTALMATIIRISYWWNVSLLLRGCGSKYQARLQSNLLELVQPNHHWGAVTKQRIVPYLLEVDNKVLLLSWVEYGGLMANKGKKAILQPFYSQRSNHGLGKSGNKASCFLRSGLGHVEETELHIKSFSPFIVKLPNPIRWRCWKKNVQQNCLDKPSYCILGHLLVRINWYRNKNLMKIAWETDLCTPYLYQGLKYEDWIM